jgi:hypothetical protein
MLRHIAADMDASLRWHDDQLFGLAGGGVGAASPFRRTPANPSGTAFTAIVGGTTIAGLATTGARFMHWPLSARLNVSQFHSAVS